MAHELLVYNERIITSSEIINNNQIILFTPPTGKYFVPKSIILEYADGDTPYDSYSGTAFLSLGGYHSAFFSVTSLIQSGGQDGKGVVIINALNSETVSGLHTITQGFPLDGNYSGPELFLQFLSSNPQNGNGEIKVKFLYELQTFG